MTIMLEAVLKKIKLEEDIKILNNKLNNLLTESSNEYNKLLIKIYSLPNSGYSQQIERIGLKTDLGKALWSILSWRDNGDSGSIEKSEKRDIEWVDGLNLIIDEKDISTYIDAMDYVYLEFYNHGKIGWLDNKFIELLNQYKNKKEYINYNDLIEKLKNEVSIKDKQLKILEKYIN